MNVQNEVALFTLLTKQNPITNLQLEDAYEELIRQIQSIQSDKNYSVLYRTLSLTRIEFVSLQSQFRYEQGEKRP